jgi:hypothetical protein
VYVAHRNTAPLIALMISAHGPLRGMCAGGQTMSIAFYPKLGMLVFGSEAAACKAGLGVEPPPPPADGPRTSTPKGAARRKVAPSLATKWDSVRSIFTESAALDEGFRLDLDDVNGEVVLLRWGEHAAGAPTSVASRPERGGLRGLKRPMDKVMRFGAEGEGCVWAANYLEGRFGSTKPLMRRVLRLAGNPLVLPIPPMGLSDPVGRDLADIPSVLQRIRDDWNDPGSSMNRLSAFTLQSRLRKRMNAYETGTHDGSVDLLISGCEASLWVGEQVRVR